MTHDLIRTKVMFLSLLSSEERMRFLADALAKVEAQVPVLQRRLEARREAGDEWDVFAYSGMLQMTRARGRWLAGIEKELRSE